MNYDYLKSSALVLICGGLYFGNNLSVYSREQFADNSLFHSQAVWTSQNGKKTKLEVLSGSPTVVAMLFTQCKGSCPLMMRDLKAIEDGIKAAHLKRVNFAVFSFDTENDTPQKLKEFAQTHGVDLNRWTYFNGSQASVRELASLLGIKFKPLAGGGFDHSNAITLLDEGGSIIYQQPGLGQGPRAILDALGKLAKP